MDVLLDVVSVNATDNHTLELVFENGEKRLFDMTPYFAKRPFIKLMGSPLFYSAAVQNGTVVWPGNIDIAPDTLWEGSTSLQGIECEDSHQIVTPFPNR